MTFKAGSIYIHCPRCTAELELDVEVEQVALKDYGSQSLVTVKLKEYTHLTPYHECFPAAVIEKRRGRRMWSATGSDPM